MKTEYITQRIIQETSSWDLSRWKYFRNIENPTYWDKQDNYKKELLMFSKAKDSYNYMNLENEYKRWKLELILRFNKKQYGT